MDQHVASGGAVAAAHPAAVQAALDTYGRGGTAVDAAIAAQAVITVVMPEAAGLGGDMLALVHRNGEPLTAISGIGSTPAAAPERWLTDGGSSVTVPGLVNGWFALHERGARLPMSALLERAVTLARSSPVEDSLLETVGAHARRMRQYGASAWPLLWLRPGDDWRQPRLAAALEAIGSDGPDAFYTGDSAAAIVAAVAATGGSLSAADLAENRAQVASPVTVPWGSGLLAVQPPPSQGVLLAMCAEWLQAQSDAPTDHILIELLEAVFASRSQAASRGRELLGQTLAVDPERASLRGGPRAYLHTAGVATVDREGTVVSSLVSVFDDFGSGVYVPELGIVLNNRAGGFTDGDNAPAPSAFPVHTLAPSMLIDDSGRAVALATPGADGQIQTLLQVLAAHRYHRASWSEAVQRPRWRGQSGEILVESRHPAIADLDRRGHRVVPTPDAADVFGGVVIAGLGADGPFAVADPRRNVRSGETV
ncbi:gamma-glutamyltransferase [Leifsonia sp. AG29]|uniref:gamma-glutamyltransferase n=1 Tax=Leifsonia sp. AG29 TaxID=2598860 RepID=UPI00131BF7BF|nr:gamma-glutamyltransferase [Leifsonia sp. AG29]